MAVQNIELLASAARASDFQGSAKEVPTITMATVTVDVTAESGTTPTLKGHLQGTDDDETTWYDIPFDSTLKTAVGATVSINQRDIAVGEETGRFVGIVKHLTYKKIRFVGEILGTTPSYTLSARLSGK